MASKYDARPMKSPNLAGFPLKVLAGALWTPILRNLVGMKALKDAGIIYLRGQKSDEEPYNPQVEFSQIKPIMPPLHSASNIKDAGVFSIGKINQYYSKGGSPVKLISLVLEHAKSVPGLMISIDEKSALKQAKASEERWKNGECIGPLDGIPIAVKDEMDVIGFVTTMGTSGYSKAASQDATIVKRAREAGAIIIGKTNLHEIGAGVTGINPHWGAVTNPYDESKFTGGSSSGSAAIVSRGIVPIALGSDGGGSIRIPSAICGVPGLKATFGRISKFGSGAGGTVGHLGPIAGNLRDLAILYSVIAGPDDKDSQTKKAPDLCLDQVKDLELLGLKIGVYRPWFEHAEEEIVERMESCLNILKSAGAEIVEITIPDMSLVRPTHLATITKEFAASHAGLVKNELNSFSPEVKMMFGLQARLKDSDFENAQRLRTKIHQNFEAAFKKCDIILTPMTGITAKNIQKSALKYGQSNLVITGAIMRFSHPANLCGYPGLSVPAGLDSDGLPIGCQLMGRGWEEETIIRAGLVLEQAFPRELPPHHVDIMGRLQ
ncbi:MAG: amidase [Candidatus Poseidoniales archaeon]